MNRDALVEEMKDLADNAFFITSAQLCKYMSISPKTARRYFADLKSFHGKYHIADVADLIVSGRCADGE